MVGHIFSYLEKWLVVLLVVAGQYASIALAQPTSTESQTYDPAFIIPGQFIIKFKSGFNPSSTQRSSEPAPLQTIYELIPGASLKPMHDPSVLLGAGSRSAETKSGIERIFRLTHQENTNAESMLLQLMEFDFIEYAEPVYQVDLLNYPNDPFADTLSGSQPYLAQIDAFRAWKLQKGKPEVIIGIVDTGIDLNHLDLKENIAVNMDDPIDGEDSDGDGYIDNYYGWNTASKNNNVSDTHGHGTRVAGFAGASTNNALGMASVGFESTILPVKVWSDNLNRIVNEWDGVLYAAHQGAKVINISWGVAGTGSNYARNMVDYLINELDVVLIAAAGNTAGEVNFYPASFPGVVSVAACDAYDQHAAWASYSKYVSLMAPGNSLLTTNVGGGYTHVTGSSFASPMVAGAAALLRAQYPQYNARQIAEQLRISADNVLESGRNASLPGMVGHGRLNIYKALVVEKPSIRVQNVQADGVLPNLLFAGDTLSLSIDWINYLSDASNVSVSISSISPYLTTIDNHYQIRQLGSLDTLKATKPQFKFLVSEEMPYATTLSFRIDLAGENYTDFEYFEIRSTREYFVVKSNHAEITTAIDGDLGYYNNMTFLGEGLRYKSRVIADRLGFMVGNSGTTLADNTIFNINSFDKNDDFISIKAPKIVKNDFADIDIQLSYKVGNGIESQLPITIEQKVLGWKHDKELDYLVLEYRMINTGSQNIEGLKTGFLLDYNLGDVNKNKAYKIQDDDVLVVNFEGEEFQFAGLMVLNHESPVLQALDFGNYYGNSTDIPGGNFSKERKYDLMSGQSIKHTAGQQSFGNDVAVMASTAIPTLHSGNSDKFVVAILTGSSEQEIIDAAIDARAKYKMYAENPLVAATFKLCAGEQFSITDQSYSFELYEDLNLTHRIDSGMVYYSPEIHQTTQMYKIDIINGFRSSPTVIGVEIDEPVVDFTMPGDGLVGILPGSSIKVDFLNMTTQAVTYVWDFDNGYGSTATNPYSRFSAEGEYQIKLTATSASGCKSTSVKTLQVLTQSPEILIPSQYQVCENQLLDIKASNTNKIKVYADANRQQLLFEGAVFTLNTGETKQTFYISNAQFSLESAAKQVQILPVKTKMDLVTTPDTLNYSSQLFAKIEDASTEIGTYEWTKDSQLLGHDPYVIVPVYGENPTELSITKTNHLGCSKSSSLVILPKESPAPAPAQIEACLQENIQIHPENGNVFIFYADAQKSKILHKGTTYSMKVENTENRIYVSSIDSLLESKLVVIDIVGKSNNASIVGENIAILGNTLNLEAQANSALQYRWILPNGQTSEGSHLTTSFAAIGEYSITMLALSATTGCIDSIHHQVSVMAVTSLNGELEQMDYTIYPNPTADIFTFDTGFLDKPIQYEIVDMNSRQLKSGYISSTTTFDLTGYANGMYFLQLYVESGLVRKKIIKRNL